MSVMSAPRVTTADYARMSWHARQRLQRLLRNEAKLHGTMSGYRLHLSIGTTPCAGCRAANATEKRIAYAVRASAEKRRLREPMPCGTRAAHERHRAHGEPPCGPCIEAARAFFRKNSQTNRDKRRATINSELIARTEGSDE